MAFGGLYHLAKFGRNRCSTFDNIPDLIFCQLGLKTPILAPKIGVLPGKVDQSSPNQEKTYYTPMPLTMPNFVAVGQTIYEKSVTIIHALHFLEAAGPPGSKFTSLIGW